MATHLVIGDPHCTPKASNDRFLWAGKFARDLKPDTIICMGDFASMDSLSSYDKGKKSFEGRRYKKDIDHAHDALDKFNKGLEGRRPRKIMLLGNHEERIDRTKNMLGPDKEILFASLATAAPLHLISALATCNPALVLVVPIEVRPLLAILMRSTEFVSKAI